MVALKTERRAFLWRVLAHAVPKDAMRPVSVDEIISIVEKEFNEGRGRVYLSSSGGILNDDDASRDEKQQLYIADMRRVPQRNAVTILINRGDPNIVSPAFIDSKDSAVRVIQPNPTESPGYSAHLLLSLVNDAQGHPACFEQMPRVSSSLVGTAIDRIVSRAVAGNPEYTYEVQLKRGKRVEKGVLRLPQLLLSIGKELTSH